MASQERLGGTSGQREELKGMNLGALERTAKPRVSQMCRMGER